MSLLLQALSWNYVLVTALISSILSQMIKVLLNLIIVGKFIPERMWGGGRNAQRTFRHSLCHGGGYGALLRHPFHPFRNRVYCVYHCDV